MPHPSDPDEQPSPPGGRPNWFVSLLMVLVCLAVVASGWAVARLVVGYPLPRLDVAEGPESRPPRSGSARTAADPEDAEAYLEAAVELLEESPAFHLTFTVHDGETDPRDAPDPGAGSADALPQPPDHRPAATAAPIASGRGQAMYDAGAEPEFDHYFSSTDGLSVYRYDVGGGQLMMTADRGLELLDPPSSADRYLCSRSYGSAKLREVLATSTDLALQGREQVSLEWPELRSTHSAYHYTGTFTAMLGGYDPESGRNTLTAVGEADFELWIDGQGYPRRLDYRTGSGVGESYEYHSFS
ncbi:hypothetical protein [Nocardiopsis sp. RV163]|uniref:hypothetical protein n=1 Tax=Nocardiopsis sp. RV163 TaxID=1661388 RepID=UPI00064BBB9D|nr:hypothetical protein [Nocardiopsis sp. RV163]